jgi:alkanesulfonate monooxygenase SsuD/methylene tetrahydromethanopterin reductase-like flavin-dependent oxidoreductase (luciferase family)
MARMEEAVRLIRNIWSSTGPVDFDGVFFHMTAAETPLTPYQPGIYPPIWLAAHGPRSLRVTGQLADGWMPARLTPHAYAAAAAAVDSAATEAGRCSRDITKAMFLVIAIDLSRSAGEQSSQDHNTSAGPVVGHPDQVMKRLCEYAAAGCQHLVVYDASALYFGEQAAAAVELNAIVRALAEV